MTASMRPGVVVVVAGRLPPEHENLRGVRGTVYLVRAKRGVTGAYVKLSRRFGGSGCSRWVPAHNLKFEGAPESVLDQAMVEAWVAWTAVMFGWSEKSSRKEARMWFDGELDKCDGLTVRYMPVFPWVKSV